MGTPLSMSFSAYQHTGVVSIQLMSPASGDLRIEKREINQVGNGFHSINVPSEWGLNPYCGGKADLDMTFNVSIQLMSPASGDSLI